VSDIKSDCITTYKAVRKSGTRPESSIRWIVLHSTEGGTAKSTAQWFANPNARGSAHLSVDDIDCYRSLLNTDIPWAAPGANTKGFHIEQVGFAKWSLVIWKSHYKTLERAAYNTAFHCHKFGIPVVWVDADGLKRGWKGITSHAECTKAFGGDHTDPGPFWPRYLFMSLVKKHYAALAGV
jgi:hypothetical protein